MNSEVLGLSIQLCCADARCRCRGCLVASGVDCIRERVMLLACTRMGTHSHFLTVSTATPDLLACSRERKGMGASFERDLRTRRHTWFTAFSSFSWPVGCFLRMMTGSQSCFVKTRLTLAKLLIGSAPREKHLTICHAVCVRESTTEIAGESSDGGVRPRESQRARARQRGIEHIQLRHCMPPPPPPPAREDNI